MKAMLVSFLVADFAGVDPLGDELSMGARADPIPVPMTLANMGSRAVDIEFGHRLGFDRRQRSIWLSLGLSLESVCYSIGFGHESHKLVSIMLSCVGEPNLLVTVELGTITLSISVCGIRYIKVDAGRGNILLVLCRCTSSIACINALNKSHKLALNVVFITLRIETIIVYFLERVECKINVIGVHVGTP